jgi:hypothetical protein
VEAKSNCFKKETKPQETQGLSHRGNEAKLFRKRNKILRIARAKPSRKQNQIVSKKKQNTKKCMGKSLHESEAKLF